MDFTCQHLFHELVEDQPPLAAALYEGSGFQRGARVIGRSRPEGGFFVSQYGSGGIFVTAGRKPGQPRLRGIDGFGFLGEARTCLGVVCARTGGCETGRQVRYIQTWQVDQRQVDETDPS